MMQAVVCSKCNGDPRGSRSCNQCKGAGIGIQSEEGFLVWATEINEVSSALRKLRIKVNAIVHLALMTVIVLCLIAFFASVIPNYTIEDVQTWLFWTSGHWFVTVFYVAIVLTAYFVFRMNEFTAQAKDLPGWMEHTTYHVQRTTPDQGGERGTKYVVRGTSFEVSPFFSPQAIEVVEAAYKLAKDLGRVEVTPEILFAAVLSSHDGALFMVRIGVSFEKIKEPLVRLMMRASAGVPPIAFSRESKRVLVAAYALADETHRKHVTPMEIFLQAFQESEKLQELLDDLGFPFSHVSHVAQWVLLQSKLREDQERFVSLARLKPKSVMNRAMTARQTSLLDRFSEDLTLLARQGYLAPMVGNQNVMEELLRGLESGQQGVVLVGETGTGKAAVVEQLARRMVEEDVPEILFDKRLVSVNLAQVVAAGEPGLAAERLLSMLHEVAMSGNIVLALYGVEALVGFGSGPMDLAETLASEMDKGYCLVIATATPQAWTQYLERRSLGKKLVKVVVPPADTDQTISVLMVKSGGIEYQNKVFFSYAALEKAASLASRYLHDVAAPQNALNVIREAAVAVRKTKGEQAFVSAEDVAKIVHDKTNIPVEMVTHEESKQLMNLEARMHGRIIGQDEAVVSVARAIRRARAELREGKRPIANFLFLGPTGVGKTECAKTLAQEYFGDETAMVRLDMSEYQDQASIAKMIGAAGDERGGLLTEAVRKKPFTIVLLDEIEKAHSEILNLFLQVMDDGRLTDGVGRTIDFTNTIVIMTSNAGTAFIQSAMSEGQSIERIKTALLERELKSVFRPEFLNRFDGVVVFKPLTRDEVVQIAWLMLNQIGKRLELKGFKFRAEDKIVEDLADAGFDPQFGARPMRRVIQDRVETPLADLLLQNQASRRDTIVLGDHGELRVEKAGEI
ncbi:MAG: ATP-dependent Clp protease ATP-binding subunit [Patescibacteria group bacterium]|nr:ATP-dependent Clp protease ATP-binding subunit [Patescibacteria group bacterium]